MRYVGYFEDDGECEILTFASDSDCLKMIADGTMSSNAKIIFETEQKDWDTANKEWNEFRDKLYERDIENGDHEEEEIGEEASQVQKQKEGKKKGKNNCRC